MPKTVKLVLSEVYTNDRW